ncbi:hypothetical protein PsYK624_074310 [Phanerochaete sordida]|uniref:Uncharacterized protein n=1 Tax=Phanerochaete sordida TaxID=48140 RepID=A0A9P3G8M0_9APHY|nr:hypothetical protein PsYK624_074310 [Phanerochaete sordida]
MNYRAQLRLHNCSRRGWHHRANSTYSLQRGAAALPYSARVTMMHLYIVKIMHIAARAKVSLDCGRV